MARLISHLRRKEDGAELIEMAIVLPLIVFPQILLCGLFVAREALPPFLEAVSDVLPLSYAVDAMTNLTRGTSTSDVWMDLLVVAAFAVGALGLGAATLRRRTP